MKPRQIVAGYLFLQAVGVTVWWALLLLFPPAIDWFKPNAWPPHALLGFWIADTLLLIGGSLVTGVLVLRADSRATIVIWSLAATLWYPTLYCIGASLLTGEAWIASGMMVSMASLTLAMATIHGRGKQSPATIRATTLDKRSAIGWTFA